MDLCIEGQPTFKEVKVPKKDGEILNLAQAKAYKVMTHFKIDRIFNVTNAKNTYIFIRNENLISSVVTVKL